VLRIEKIQASALHSESNGSLERSHRVLTEYLRNYVREDQTNWDEWVPYAVYVYNTTAYTPFELVYGFKSEVLSALREIPNIQYNYGDYLAELRGRLQSAHEVARQKIILSKEEVRSTMTKILRHLKFKPGRR